MSHSFRLSALALTALAPAALSAQISLVNPIPHEVNHKGSTLTEAPKAWTVVCDKARSASIAAKALAGSAIPQSAGAPFKVTIGLKGDKAVKKYARLAPAKAEGYYLELSPKGAVIVGSDESGLYYGVQTLLASLAEGKLETATVTDWPDVPFRGTVEGFYGTPWSHAARLSQIEFYGRNKMNAYIYGPKDDPYHRDKWRLPYPEAEAQRIKELNAQAKLHGVHFYWAIHPGVDIKWTTEDRDALMAKLEQMYALGIRSFAVFFDDIWGEGAKADKQADLLNYIDNNFVQKKGDVAPLVLCPTEYNRSWANDEKGYLRTLGDKLNKSVNVMWTGNTVVHDIDKGTLEWVSSRIKRKPFIWYNFPVSDYVRDHLLLGPAYGNGLDIAADLSGFVSNPMEHAEASKISLYGIADYTWNMKAYDPKRDWEKALQAVLPDNAGALRTFALYNKDAGPNGHGYRREEGDELKALAAAALKGDTQAIAQLIQKSMELKMAADVLLTDKSNPELIRELRPWLLQAKNVGDYGQAVCLLSLTAAAPKGMTTFPTFTDAYKQARSLKEQMYELENSDVRHPLQPGIKLGTKVLLPTLGQLFTQAVEKYNAANGTKLDATADYNPYKLSSDVKQLALLPVSVNGNNVTVAPSLEVINWQKDGQLTIACDRDITFAGMDFNLGTPDVAKNFKLELLQNGQWTTVSLLHYKADDPVIHTGNELGGMKASALRLTNVSGKDLQVYFKSFKFVKQ